MTSHQSSTCTLSSVKVKDYGDGKGRGIVAAASSSAQTKNTNSNGSKVVYKKGDIILTVEPDVATLYSAFASCYCARCFLKLAESSGDDADGNNNNNNNKNYTCPTCDQFVLCAQCYKEIHQNDNTTKNNNDISNSDDMDDAPFLLRVHRLVCGWYNELPAAVIAKGEDTDYLRFALRVAATSMLEEKEEEAAQDTILKCEQHPQHCSTLNDKEKHTLTRSLLLLDGCEASQSKENKHFCDFFAKEKILKTFGPSTTCPASVDANRVERMTIDGNTLSSILLITKNNSLGFPFSFSFIGKNQSNNSSEIIGWSLQNTMCLLNHSCDPNAEIISVAEVLQQESGEEKEKKSESAAALREAFVNTKIKKYENPNFELEKGNANGTDSHDKKQNVSLAGCMALRALRDIGVSGDDGNEGEEITISYVNLEDDNGYFAKNVKERSRHLLEQYRFLCQCAVCVRQRAELRQQQQQKQLKK